MAPQERLKYMREWLKHLNDTYPEDNKKKIECLNWAIKQCQKNVDRNRDSKRSWEW